MKVTLIAFLLLSVSLTSGAVDQQYTVVRVDTTSENLQTFIADEQGKPFKTFVQLSTWLQGKGEKLTFAMNAGMYHRDLSPVGLLVVAGKQVSPLNTSAGSGNFFLKPNGVFLLSLSGPKIVATAEYAGLAVKIQLATQSGPLLLRNGVIHAAFNSASTSRFIRNGVGVSGNVAFFVISEQPVTFYEFAAFFRDVLHCSDALYLDGVVSSLYSVDLKRSDQKAEMGPIVGAVVDQPPNPSIERTSNSPLRGLPATAHVKR